LPRRARATPAALESWDITVIGDGLGVSAEGAGLLANDKNVTWDADAGVVICPRMYAASSSGDAVVPLGPVVLSAAALSATSDQLYFVVGFDGVKGSLRRLSLSGTPSVVDVADGVLPQYVVGRGLRAAYRTAGAGGALLATSGAASVPLMNGATAIQVTGSTGEDVLFATRQFASPSDPQNGLYVLPWP